MTLDSLTRAQAEATHATLKNSLARASAEFREHFEAETELFRSLPVTLPLSLPLPLDRTTAPVRALTDDLVRVERLAQCCKRVRIWRRQIANPLLQYKHHQVFTTASIDSKPTNGITGGSGTGSTMTSKKSDRRMHITLLMALIVDMYEQRLQLEVDDTSNALGMIQETFPEFVARAVSQRTTNRRAAVEQLSSIVAAVGQAATTHHRAHLFGSLCGIVDDNTFNPPERITLFLHVLERLYRAKAQLISGSSGNSSINTTGNAAGATTGSADATMATVVFHTIGVPQAVAQSVVAALFADDFYWNFQFWHAQCVELRVDYRWPRHACEELQDRVFALAVSSRIALLSNLRKIDGDAFLALIVDVWTERARVISALLEVATDREEERSQQALQHRQQVQDARAHVLPLCEREVLIFDALIDEFWNADVPWSSPSVQRRLAPVAHVRPLHELKELYRTYVAQLDASRKSWDWLGRWRWETDWEWGVLLIDDDDDDDGD